MNDQQLALFIESITPVILEAGELAINSQTGIINIGKDLEIDDDRPERIKQRNRAKTETDESVQEIILKAVKERFGTQFFKIDAEENTPTRSEFNNPNSIVTLVIDPIDRTLEYVNGSDRYSINVGLIEDGEMLLAIVYSPRNKEMYYLDENKKPYLKIYSKYLQLVNEVEIQKIHNNQKTVYTNNRVPSDLINNLRNLGYTVVEDTGEVHWPDALIKCMRGEYMASIFHTPQTRDVLLGALVESLSDGYMIDWNGNKLIWPSGGRIPEVIFGTGDFPNELIKIINK